MVVKPRYVQRRGSGFFFIIVFVFLFAVGCLDIQELFVFVIGFSLIVYIFKVFVVKLFKTFQVFRARFGFRIQVVRIQVVLL